MGTEYVTDYTDLGRFDSEVLQGIIHEHMIQISWYEKDIRRIVQELEHRASVQR